MPFRSDINFEGKYVGSYRIHEAFIQTEYSFTILNIKFGDNRMEITI